MQPLTVLAFPPPGATTYADALALNLPAYWCGYTCRKDGTYLRTTRGHQCCACKARGQVVADALHERESKRLAGQREKAREKAAAERAKTRRRRAAALKQEAARALKEADKVAQKQARAAFREAIRRAAIAAKAKATREAKKAAAEQAAQTAATAAAPQGPAMVFDSAPWDDDSGALAGPLATPVELPRTAHGAAPNGGPPSAHGISDGLPSTAAPWESDEESKSPPWL